MFRAQNIYSRLDKTDPFHWAVLDQAALGCTGLHWAVVDSTTLYWAVLGCIWLYWALLGFFGPIGLCWAVLLCNWLYRAGGKSVPGDPHGQVDWG